MDYSPIAMLHISMGALSLVAGAAAMMFRKGSPRHRATGKLFVVFMLLMSSTGAYRGVVLSDGAFFGGFLTFYLVVTSWMTLQGKEGDVGPFDIGALLYVVALSAAGLYIGSQAANTDTGSLYKYPATYYYVFAALGAYFAFSDVKLLYRRGVSGAKRIVRHLGRMCFGFFFAVTSFFLGQMKHLPEFILDRGLHFVPVVVLVVLWLFWYVRVRFTKWYEEPDDSSPNAEAS